jgi:membrane protease YdiL (CAAX protease family)
LIAYLAGTYIILWGGFLAIAGVRHWHGDVVHPLDVLILFPFGVLGVGVIGVAMTAVSEGRRGIGRLRSRMGRWRIGWRWYAVALAAPPIMVVSVLSVLRVAVAPEFAPNRFFLGLLFGLLPGFAEEIGWTGFALPRMLSHGNALRAALGLGVLWAVWHLPVVNFLGSASPHGAYWLPFFLGFATVLVAMRVLMVWVYGKTGSVLIAQLMHASSTGSLVVFGPDKISPAQEAAWYGLYGATLFVVVIVIVSVEGTNLGVYLER